MRNALLLAGLFIALTPHAHSQAKIGTGSVKSLYDDNCSACHGKEMEGGASVSLVDDEWIHGSDDKTITRIIRDGVTGTSMQGYADVLNSEQIRSLVVLITEYKSIAKSAAQKPMVAAADGVRKSDLHTFKLEHLFDAPGTMWGLDFLPDGSMLVTQKAGKLWHSKDGKKLSEISGIPEAWVNGQGGLLDVQVHPDYERNGWVYLSYAEHTGAMDNGRKAGMTAIARGRISNGKWTDSEVVFRFPEELHVSSGAHFGSRIVFKDGLLHFSVGDRGNQDSAQDLSAPSGKIHRITADGHIPRDNPFLKTKDALPSIFSYGNRNPQGLAFNPETGALWETEHGPRGGDELNVIESGHNYGWPKVTFGINYNGRPISDLTHAEGITPPLTHWTPSIAIAGMDFYAGDKFPEWQGHLFLGGMSAEELYRIETKGKTVVNQELVLKGEGRIRDVVAGPDGHIYLLLNSKGSKSGKIARLVPAK